MWFLPSPFCLLRVCQTPPSNCPFQGLMTEVCTQSVFLTKEKTSELSVVRQHPPPVSCSQPLPCQLWFLRLTVGRKPRLASVPSRSSLCFSGPAPKQGDSGEAKI